MRSRAWMAVVGLIVGVPVAVLLAVAIFAPTGTGERPPALAEPTPPPSWAPPVALPPTAAQPTGAPAGLVDPDWLAGTSAATGIPERVLAAYAGATIVKTQAMPECGLSWTTLAAIGAVESDHGRHGGSLAGPDGVVSPPIYGVALDGDGTADIDDSDGGAIDGDPEHDRAVGPMQLIPQAWRNWHVDADGDGVENPQDVDDAVTAAANYLCRASTAQDTEAGWRAAIAAYNSAPSYLDAVATAGVRYGEATAD